MAIRLISFCEHMVNELQIYVTAFDFNHVLHEEYIILLRYYCIWEI